MHVCARSFALVIMRDCSNLRINLITELPAQIFDKNVKLDTLCVHWDCLCWRPSRR